MFFGTGEYRGHFFYKERGSSERRGVNKMQND